MIGSKDKEHGPRLVKRPAVKTKNMVSGPWLLSLFSFRKLTFRANSEINKLIDAITGI